MSHKTYCASDIIDYGANSGNWGNIHFRVSDSVLDNVIIRYAGRKGLPWWMNVGAITLDENIEVVIKNSLIEKNIYAVSFTLGTSCDEINAMINEFIAENTVFQDNQQLTYPGCP